MFTLEKAKPIIDKDIINECKELLKEKPPQDVEMQLNIEQAAFLLGVSKQTLRNWEASGKLSPMARTEGGHRRYTKSQIDVIKKEQLGCSEFVIPKITPEAIREMIDSLLSSFDSYKPVNISIRDQRSLNGKVVLTVDSHDGLDSVSKSFNALN